MEFSPLTSEAASAEFSGPGDMDASAAAPINAMSVDVEEYFQVSAFEKCIDRGHWEGLESRVEYSTGLVLDLLDAASVEGTFFILGWVAERHPGLVRRIVGAGHEVASHGYGHERVCEMTPEAFRADVQRARTLLQDISGQPVVGYRAPSFSIGAGNLWALDVLEEEGYAYSSSIYPIRHDLYGMPEAERFAFRPREGGGLIEVPMTTVNYAGRNFPCGGGGYFRLLPYWLMKRGLDRVNGVEGRAGVFYCHPWEFDPAQPRQEEAGLRSRFRHYTNLDGMAAKVSRLLNDFRWGRMDEIFLGRRH